MKSVSKIAILILTAILFVQPVLVAQAKENGKKPDPRFKEKAVHIDKSHRPYYGKDVVVDTYLLDGINYAADSVSEQVVEIVPQDIQYKTDATFSEEDLKGQAEKFVSEFLGNEVDLNNLSFNLGQKVGTYFFRWENANSKLDDGTHAFIQVGLSANGDFLNFVNTLPFGNTATSAQNKAALRPAVMSAPLIGPFNEIYANGGSYWRLLKGSMTTRTGGYFYIYSTPPCSGTFCSTFYSATASASGGTKGAWVPNGNSNTKASVFIPSTYATANVTYAVIPNSGTTMFSSVDQNAFYNAWVSLTLNKIQAGVLKVTLENNASSGTVAWDEAWVYNP